jgi:cytochrome c oxidase cbb3-type subunit 2
MVGPPSDEPSRPAPSPNAELEALGQTLYTARCAGCHGAKGDGRGPQAAGLSIPPSSFVEGVYKLRSTRSGSLPTDQDLFRTLTRGIHGTPMLPWTRLAQDQRWALVLKLKSCSARFQRERPGPVIPVPSPPREDSALREKGRTLFRVLACVNCHGAEGAGDGPGARAYDDSLPKNRDWRFRDFTRGRFIRGAEMKDLYLTLRAGIDGTPMASYDALGDDEIWALAAYVRALVRERPLHELPPARGRT